MRYSEMAGKEIVDISAGMRLGLVAGTDLVIDTVTGSLEAIVIFQRTGLFATHEITVPWDGVKKVGKDLIIVDISAATEPMTGRSRVSRLHSPRRTLHFVPGVAADEDNSTEASFPSDGEDSYLASAESDIMEDKRSFRRRSGR
jgi:YlmC/YmxH family sporulation protein